MSEAVLDKIAEHLTQVDGSTFAAILSLLPTATQASLIQRCASLKQNTKSSELFKTKTVASQLQPTGDKSDIVSKPGTVNIKVLDASGNECYIAVKKPTELGRVRKAYAERMGKPDNSVRFTYDGTRLSDTDTPEILDMEDGDVIIAMHDQPSGYW